MNLQRGSQPQRIFHSHGALYSAFSHDLATPRWRPTSWGNPTRSLHVSKTRSRSLGRGRSSKSEEVQRRLGQTERRIKGLQNTAEERHSRKVFTKKQFEELVHKRLQALSVRLDNDSTSQTLGLDKESLRGSLSSFSSFVVAELNAEATQKDNEGTLVPSLRIAFTETERAGLDKELQLGFYRWAINSTFSEADIASQKKLADLRFPEERHPKTRALHRKIHLHVGPTNSGKTYQALKRLDEAKQGVYAGPLRLLAHEVYSRLSAKGLSCDLLTGDEQIFSGEGESSLSSCTVEMVPLEKDLDVAVIDEIQMLSDNSRGWAWTQAFLGVKAKEVHVCGEERAEPLVRRLAAACGDELIVHRYERLSPLRCMDQSLMSDLRNLRKGDCVVVFSRLGLHFMKREIETRTQKRCAIVYGSLPPQIRAQQAKLFNDLDNDYDYLVASDAIGMGLNL